MRATTQAILNKITDCFTAADGGIQFVRFRNLLDILDNKAAAGDPAAVEILLLVERFSRLIDVKLEGA